MVGILVLSYSVYILTTEIHLSAAMVLTTELHGTTLNKGVLLYKNTPSAMATKILKNNRVCVFKTIGDN